MQRGQKRAESQLDSNVKQLKASKQVFNAIWLSDVHLGTKDCKAQYLLQLLKQTQTETLYLVGDIIDIWAMKRRVYWPESHNQVLQQLVSMARNGTQIIYIPGNHDEQFKSYDGFHLWDVSIAKEHVHTMIGGQRILMLHGDQFDSQVCVGKALTKLGDRLYDILLLLNRQLHKVRTHLGYPYWSLASYIKLRVNKAQQAISLFRDAVVTYATDRGVDGVICGHIHQPELSREGKMIYANDGDWVENCTFIAESERGDLQLRQWDEQQSDSSLISSISLGRSAPKSLKKRVA
ncbi:UDP-2,3-diacylglucosamine diphosphatase [Shewanella sp. UCD-KL12]|uniref:UDP-2,3-diacylglucosamine diphosphatase n=1 Tax=Shewanella sp. UCD-KL12 TaxID=1917163 RepID=UPI00117EBD0F|nr:UDP-2,3-diacylglucosamine diphosphatase [Shewanella sp. UCD-KL12]